MTVAGHTSTMKSEPRTRSTSTASLAVDPVSIISESDELIGSDLCLPEHTSDSSLQVPTDEDVDQARVKFHVLCWIMYTSYMYLSLFTCED